MLPILAIMLGIAIIMGTMLIAIVVTRDRKLQIFSRFRTATAGSTEDIKIHELQGNFEFYGNLPTPPDRQPVRVALDVMTCMFLATGLPTHTVILPSFPSQAYLAGSTIENGILGQGSPHAIEKSTAIPSSHYEKSSIEGELPKTASEASSHYLAFPRSVDSGGRQSQSVEKNNAKAVGQWVESAYGSENETFVVGGDEEILGGEDGELAIDPISFSFGSGKAMAGLYH